jgi:hypothetical protein
MGRGVGRAMRIFMTHIEKQPDLESTLFSKTYLACVVLLGMLFGFSSYFALYDEAHMIDMPVPFMVMVFIITGILTIFAYYFSFLAMIWAMSRLFKGRNKFLGFIRVSANTLPPLWIALPILNFYVITGMKGNIAYLLLGLAGLCVIVFFGRMISIISSWFEMTKVNTSMTLLATLLFLCSFLYLQLG